MPRKIEVYASTNKIGSRTSTEIEVEDDASDDEIEETARATRCNEHLLDWGWKPVTPDPGSSPRRRR